MAFQSLGYETCPDGTLEENTDKIAIYVDAYGTPTHVARQLSTGAWTSKLGRSQDIEHRTELVLEGAGQDCYGHVRLYMKRPSRPAI
jgi:hypothetical protein